MNSTSELLPGSLGANLPAASGVAGMAPSAPPVGLGFAHTLNHLKAGPPAGTALEQPEQPELPGLPGGQQAPDMPLEQPASTALAALPADPFTASTPAATADVAAATPQSPLGLTFAALPVMTPEGTGTMVTGGNGLPLSTSDSGKGLPLPVPAPPSSGTSEPLPPAPTNAPTRPMAAAVTAESESGAVTPGRTPMLESAVDRRAPAAAFAALMNGYRGTDSARNAAPPATLAASPQTFRPTVTDGQTAAMTTASGSPPAPQPPVSQLEAAMPLAGRAGPAATAAGTAVPANVMGDGATLPEAVLTGESAQTRRQVPDALSQAMQTLMRQGVPAAETGAAVGVLDRRAILEAAARQGARRETLSGGSETVDRAGALTTEAADPSPRQPTPRLQAAPQVMGRDLAALVERMEMLVHRRAGTANLNMTLSELGEVEITVRMESRQAHLQFVVHDAAARDALESALPRLRALLEQGGLSLGDVAMNQSGQSGTGADRQRPERAPRPAGTSSSEPAVAEAGPQIPHPGGSDRLLDAFV